MFIARVTLEIERSLKFDNMKIFHESWFKCHKMNFIVLFAAYRFKTPFHSAGSIFAYFHRLLSKSLINSFPFLIR